MLTIDQICKMRDEVVMSEDISLETREYLFGHFQQLLLQARNAE